MIAFPISVHAIKDVTLFALTLLRTRAQQMDQASSLPQKRLNSDLIYEVVPGDLDQPFFFCGLRRRIAQPGRWTATCALYAVANWAPGREFIEAGSIQELAAGHVRALRQIQPSGPYMLGGYCQWALVAYEMAQQLKGAGEDVSLLFLVDPMAANRVRAPGHKRRASRRDRFRVRLNIMLKGPRSGGLLAWLYNFLPGRTQIYRIKKKIEFQYVRRAILNGKPLRFQRIFDAYWHETGNWFRYYKSSPYEGACRIVLTAAPREVRFDQFGADAQVRSIVCGHADVFHAEAMDQWVPWLTEEIAAARRRQLAVG
jgi:hypothetical protein